MSDPDDLAVAEGRVVVLELTLTDPEGELLDHYPAEAPLAYLHGADNVSEGLEEALLGKRAGARVEGEIPPAKAFGERIEEAPSTLSRFAFPRDARLHKGMHFHVEREGGMEDFYLLRVEGEKVYADRNHPLAGVTIGFDAKVLAVREARPDEIEHGHPHVEGHHHH